MPNELTPEQLRRLAEFDGYENVAWSEENQRHMSHHADGSWETTPVYDADATAALRLVEKLRQQGVYLEVGSTSVGYFVGLRDFDDATDDGGWSSDIAEHGLFPAAVALAVSAVLESRERDGKDGAG